MVKTTTKAKKATPTPTPPATTTDRRTLKIRAAQERTTVGELIEQWVEGWR